MEQRCQEARIPPSGRVSPEILSLKLELEVKQVRNDVVDIELTTEQIEVKVEWLLRDIGGLKREILKIATLCLGYEDHRT
jgi:hypothetical protein